MQQKAVITYIKERYVNLNQKQQMASSFQQTPKNPEIFQNYSTAALRSLKQTEDHMDSMKRRLSVLQIREDKTLKRIQEGERKLEFHARVQHSIYQDKKRKQRFRQKMQKQLERSRSRAKLQRETHEQNLKAIKQDLSAKKRAQYERIKATSQFIDKSLDEMKINEKQAKIKRQREIRKMEENQKLNISQYFLQKKNNFRESSVREGSGYISRRSQRQQLLKQYSKIQSQMLQRQSASRAVLDLTSKKLQQKVTIKTHGHTKSTREKSSEGLSEKLPPLTFKNHDQLIIL